MSSTDDYYRRVEALYEREGIKAPWTRVWEDGIDITDTVPPAEWPWPWRMYYEQGRWPRPQTPSQ